MTLFQLLMSHRSFVVLAVVLNWLIGFLISAALYLRKNVPGNEEIFHYFIIFVFRVTYFTHDMCKNYHIILD